MQCPKTRTARNLICWFASVLIAAELSACAVAAPEQTSNVSDQAAVEATLDELHAQAAAANYDAYFALYESDAVFLGTDRTEYWPIEDFKAYSKARFDTGTGWTYTPLTRELHFFENTAWFEEELLSESYGQVRGTGVLIRTAQGWKITQYNLTLPIPNDLFDDIAQDIKTFYKATATSQVQPSQ